MATSGDYIAHFKELVAAATRDALAGSASPWIALSGGLDSNTLLPPALQHAPSLTAYSIISPQWREADESPWIERVVGRTGIPWHAINAEDVLPFGDFPDAFCGGPDTAVIHRRFDRVLTGLIGGSVLLTGDGGDSFMGAQLAPVPMHLADPLFCGRLRETLSDVARWRRGALPHRSAAYWAVHGLVLPSVRHLARRPVRAPHYHLRLDWLNPATPGDGAAPGPGLPRCATPGQQAILDDLWRCAEDSQPYDKGYESRHPLFTRALFEFLWAIPWSQKLIPSCDRYLQRRALKGLVDDEMRTRISFGMGSRTF
ncbi:asparagine synthase-related protein, partial [Polymorphobacter multimanifer]|uniref:asparagine synthase-related protein n=1 Tax=Polymorphobacter multimanifer TaxID=1070431 RepID=UPI00188D569E